MIRLAGSAVAVFSLALAGCMTSRAQLDRRQSFGGDPTHIPLEEIPVRGFDVSIEAHDGERQYFVDGELLAVDARDVWVLDEAGDVTAVERAQIVEVDVEVYDQHTDGFVVWTVVGSLSTLSHGFFLVFSLPTWLATGIASSVNSEATDDIAVNEPTEIDRLTQFARFPQGLPPHFEARTELGTAEWLGGEVE